MPDAVPKFGSFRPKPSTPTSPQKDVQATDDRDHNRHKHKDRHRRGRPDPRERYERLELHKPQDKTFPSTTSASGTKSCEARNADDSRAQWLVDRKGNPALLQYQSSQSWSGAWSRGIRPLGDENSQVFARDNQGSPLKALTKGALRALAHEGSFVDPNSRRSPHDVQREARQNEPAGFISIHTGRKRKRGSGTRVGALSSRVLGEDAESSASDSSSDPATTNEAGRVFAISSVRQRHADLETKLRLEPANISAWQHLISLQDDWAAQGLMADSSGSTKADKTTVADLRMSVVDSALKTLPKYAEGREALLLRKLEIYEDIVTQTELLQKWRNVTLEYPLSYKLSSRYLHRLHTTKFNYSVDSCREEYQRMLRLPDDGDGPHIEEKLHILLRFTCFLRSAGYDELAIAIWQATLELRFFTADMHPSSVHIKDQETLRSRFEDFWDTETPRIGEEGARGWQLEHLDVLLEPHTVDHESDTNITARSNASGWALKEGRGQEALEMPGKTTDDDAQDDPYHTILFSDIEPFWSACSTAYPVNMLVNAFLQFCALPALPANDEPRAFLQLAADDAFIHADIQFGSNKTGKEDTKDAVTYLKVPTDGHRSWQICAHTTASCAQLASFNSRVSSSNSFAERVIGNLVNAMPENDLLAEYYLAYICIQSTKRARKVAKNLLKRRPDCLRLYNAYALVELRAKGSEAASRVFETSIKMSRTLNSPKVDDAIYLWRTWAWVALHEGRPEYALQRMTLFGKKAFDVGDGIREVSRTDLLRTKDALDHGFHVAVTAGRIPHAIAHVDLLSYLAYVTPTLEAPSATPALSPALEVQRAYLRYLPQSTKSALEYLAQLLSLLVLHHRTTYPRAPIFIPELILHLQQAASSYPSNYIILTALTTVTPRTDRIRALLTSSSNPSSISLRSLIRLAAPQTLTAWTVAIEAELKHAGELEAGMGEWAVRRTFERAVDSELGKHSPELWSWWLRWELDLARDVSASASNLEKARRWKRAKEVWKKGKIALPWVKAWVVEGLAVFADEAVVGKEAVGRDEALALFDEMVEKGFRVRVDMRELLSEPD